METVSVFVINFNGRNTVLKTLRSIYDLVGARVDVQVIDDGSTDGSDQMIRDAFPGVPVHRQPQNTRRLNVLRNIALRMAGTPRVLITDNDVLFEAPALAELLSSMDADERIATCTPRLMHWDEPSRIYRAGGLAHYIGAAICRGRDEIASDVLPMRDDRVEPNSGGGILLLNRDHAISAGGFDEDYMIGWGDDGEFYQRLLLYGYRCLYVPSAVAIHESKPFTGVRRARAVGQIYNRWQLILTHYQASTLVLILPVLVMYELLQLGFMAGKGMLGLHFSGNLRTLSHLARFWRKRRRIQARRACPDADVLFCGPIYVAGGLVGQRGFLRFGLKAANGLFDAYWRLVRVMLRYRRI